MKLNNLFYAPAVIGLIERSEGFERQLITPSRNPKYKKFHLQSEVTNGMGYNPIRTEKPKIETESDLIRHLGEMELRCQINETNDEYFTKCEVGSALYQTERAYLEQTRKINELCDLIKIRLIGSERENRELTDTVEQNEANTNSRKEKHLEEQKKYQGFRQISGALMTTGLTAGTIILSAKNAYEFAAFTGIAAIGCVADLYLAEKRIKTITDATEELRGLLKSDAN